MAQIKGFVVAHGSVFVAVISQFPFQPKPAILQKLKKMHILEKVNSQSKQVQLVQNINMERDVRIHMGADAGIQEEPTFDHAEWDRLTRENFEKEYLTTQLKKFGGNISKTAKFVGMERSALHRKLKGLGVKDLN